MLRNWFASAIGNFARNWLYAGVTVIGLALAFAAAIVIALFVRHEATYERFVPGYEHAYRLTQWYRLTGREPADSELTPIGAAAELKAGYSDVTAAARLIQDYPRIRSRPTDQGARDASFAWADPDFFRVFPLRAIAGDLQTALRQPGTVVLTRSAARRYFGRDVPMGAMLDVALVRRGMVGLILPERPSDHRLLRVAAVLEDLPSTTHLTTQMFGSTLGIYTATGRTDQEGPAAIAFTVSTMTYFRLAPSASLDQLDHVLAKMIAPVQATMPGKDDRIELRALPIADIHTGPPSQLPEAKPTSDPRILAGIGVIGALIVLIASTNFVTLMTARAGRRGVEVGVRKACGASRTSLIVQFLGEAFLQVLLAMILAMAMVELVLPVVNNAIDRQLEFRYFADPIICLGLVGLTLAVSLLAGLYPAFFLSAIRPSIVLKGGLASGGGGSALIRQGLVLLQFAILVLLIVATATIYRQTNYALNRALNAAGDPIVTVRANCDTGFPQAVRQLRSVRAASCASQAAFNLEPKLVSAFPDRAGRIVPTALSSVDPDFFAVFGTNPLAGRVFSWSRPADSALNSDHAARRLNVVVNESFVRGFGLGSPASAVGQTLRLPPSMLGPAEVTIELIGVVPDQPQDVRAPTYPELYFVGDLTWGMVAARTSASELSITRGAIRALWPNLGDPGAIQDGLMSQLQRTRYQDIVTQGTVIAVGAGLALFIACLGLFALSAFTAEQRIKEIGVRKAMGAGTGAILRLLLWQFTKPVLLANLVAWPLAWWAMSRWLQGFAYRVQLPLWLFAIASAATVVIAWSTTFIHALLVARAKPVEALRYE
jgi:putative ABC transport system permease protein